MSIFAIDSIHSHLRFDLEFQSISFRFGRIVLMSSLLFHHYAVSIFAMSAPSPPSPIQSVTTTHFHIQFDGCLRPPRDSGFPTITHRMAVCAACIGKVHACNYDNERDSEFHNDHETTVTPLAVGAMELPVSTETTSQHAEYEGLLMGLEWLVEFISCQNRNEKNMFDEDFTGDDDGEAGKFPIQQREQHARVFITIEGDCKTVIDQLTGKSIPRKLESLHQRAESLLDKLGSVHIITTDSGMHSNVDDRFEAEYRHIPRNQNSISDSLCNNLMNIISAKSWMGSIDELEKAENQIMEQRLSSSQVSTASSSLSEIFETVTRNTKYSLRPPLYEMVANLAVKTEDYKLLVKIGERLIEEESSLNANTNTRPRREGGDRGHVNSRTTGRIATSLKRAAVNYQIRGWEGLGNEKKIRFLQRKYRILLSNGNDSDTGKNDDFIPLIEDEKCDGRMGHLSESTESSHISNQMLKNLGDVTEGQWNVLIPDVWKPMLDKWFVSARYERVNEIVEGKLSPVWVVET
jgi:hypothetical protein